MQSSSSSWVGYGKLAVNAHSAPKMAIGETTQMWQILFVVSLFFVFCFPHWFPTVRVFTARALSSPKSRMAYVRHSPSGLNDIPMRMLMDVENILMIAFSINFTFVGSRLSSEVA